MSICPHTNDMFAMLIQAWLSAITASLYRQPELLSIFHLRGLQKGALGALVVKYTGVIHRSLRCQRAVRRLLIVPMLDRHIAT